MSDKKKDEAPKCQYNSGVECRLREKPCEGCGWNPAVAKERLEKFRKQGYRRYPSCLQNVTN